MASRLHQRNARDALFSAYDPSIRSRPASAASASPAPRPSSRNNNPAPYSTYHTNNSSPYFASTDTSSHLGAQPPPSGGFSAYPGASSSANSDFGAATRRSAEGFRPATPDRKGRYADAVYDEMESQNDEQVGIMTEKVKMLKNITIAIGDEIRDSTAFAEKMNDSFERTGNQLRGTMTRMVRMAERSGIGWRIWLGFFAFVTLLFVYIWLF